jgi:hypothetical protein
MVERVPFIDKLLEDNRERCKQYKVSSEVLEVDEENDITRFGGDSSIW